MINNKRDHLILSYDHKNLAVYNSISGDLLFTETNLVKRGSMIFDIIFINEKNILIFSTSYYLASYEYQESGILNNKQIFSQF